MRRIVLFLILSLATVSLSIAADPPDDYCDDQISYKKKTPIFKKTGRPVTGYYRLAYRAMIDHSAARTLTGIIHVMDALSGDPEIRILPNPYSKKYKSFYQIEDAGLRIRYEAK